MKKPSKNKLLSTKAIFENLSFQKKGIFSDLFRLHKIKKNWNFIVGSKYHLHIEPVRFHNHCLWVRSSEPILNQELSFQSHNLQQKINKCVGQLWVKKIYFTM